MPEHLRKNAQALYFDGSIGIPDFIMQGIPIIADVPAFEAEACLAR